MSTELNSITGRMEIPDPKRTESDYELTEMNLTAFAGPSHLGRMVQLTVGNYPNFVHIQIDTIQAVKLRDILQSFIAGEY